MWYHSAFSVFDRLYVRQAFYSQSKGTLKDGHRVKPRQYSRTLLFGLSLLLFSCTDNDPSNLGIDSSSLRDTIAEIDLSHSAGHQDSTLYAAALLDSAAALLAHMEYDRALDTIQKAKKHYGERIGEKSIALIRVLNLESAAYFHKLNLDSASAKAERALEIADTIEMKNDALLGDIFFNLGNVAMEAGNSSLGIDYFQRDLSIKQSVYGREHPKLASIYLALGETYSIKGDYGKALGYAHQSLNLIQKDENPAVAVTIANYNTISNIYENQGDLSTAIQYLKQGIQLGEQYLSPDNHQLALLYSNLGKTYERVGEYGWALEYLHRSLGVRLKHWGEKHAHTSDVYFNMAVVYGKQEAYEKSLLYLNKSLEIDSVVRGPDHPYVADAYNNMGIVAEKLGKFEEAQRFYKKSLAIKFKTLGEHHPLVSHTYANIGSLHEAQGLFSEAVPYFQKSLDIKLNTQGANNTEIAQTYYALGLLFTKMGRLPEGLTNLHEAMAVLNYDRHKPMQFEAVTNLEILKDVLLAKADYYRKKLAVTDPSESTDSVYAQYRVLLALEDYAQGMFLNEFTRQFYAYQSLPVYEGAIELFMARNEPHQAFEIAEKTKSRRLAESIQAITKKTTFNLPDSLIKRESEIAAKIFSFEKKVYQEVTNDSLLLIYEDSLFQLRRDKNSLLETLKENFPEYYQLRYSPEIISVSQVQEQVLNREDQALVEYFVGDSSIYLFTVLKDTFYTTKVVKDFPLEEWIQNLRCSILAEASQDTSGCSTLITGVPVKALYSQYASLLYDKLFRPLEQQLAHTSELLLVPDGKLGYLPFEILLQHQPEALTDFYQFPYLLRKYAIGYAYSATLQREMQDKKHAREPAHRLLAVAPVFSGSQQVTNTQLANRLVDTTLRRNVLTPLAYNVPEAQQIAARYGGEVWVGEEATKQHFVKRAADYRILHLSTHGKANDKKGDYSFLAFQPRSADSLNDALLYNSELYTLSLNADLVVLSACETGIGELQRGEGIISLARGFSYGGAKSLVTSLWNVNDRSTKEIMEAFYDYLAQDLGKHEALRQAKLAYLERHKDASYFQSPYYWAAYIPIGDMAPVALAPAFRYRWLLIVAVLCLAGYFYWRSRNRQVGSK
ncbi:CHAT domain-containing protein [Flavilitoribacter nigricans]|uniref:CHAT domain-containing protein n=1 Tax=Flavilitoribacter nigricans (strain ATCC 23147 / DSM 23189 / NBRC 102662 / NCIMB 1420 / SS-2) TaxID=1122177 RepID=A0A2D0N0X7_FLAN2|nr:CHAT domain-containing tetratricopeptide repeat protein [Flavilitoribacter nigricans]PHN02202.1 hypothetical protein CRP01_33245 [Flavilitoribacter nigricans DSM 23189 = NBRC 102662]